ncbi:MAG: hypothetical protein U0174_08985 [Polyangiaceae bacterium]
MRVFRLGSVAATIGFSCLAACATEPAATPTDGGTPPPTVKDAGTPPPVDAAPTPTCTDKVQNGTETGVDCGGSCKKCDGDTCALAADCQSQRCEKNVCVPIGVKTCGVGQARLCDFNETCTTDTDCESDYCFKTRCNKPGPESHTDGRKNAGETDVDCGGPSGVACDLGKKCKVPADCTVNCVANVCVDGNDHDGLKNNGETDVDCGGANAPKCATGKACIVGSDCGFGDCNAQVCVTPTSSDGRKNGNETDVDCGGGELTFDGVTVPAAPGCALTKKCVANADCGSNACASNNICIEGPSCRAIHGGQTCGKGEFGAVGAEHESCCKMLPVPGITITQNGVAKQVYLDKYEITAGRIRAWIEAMLALNGGDIQTWIKDKMAADPVLAQFFPSGWADYLPLGPSGPIKTFSNAAGGGGTVNLDMGIDTVLGQVSYYRGVQVGGTSGCSMLPNAYGHRTLMYDPATDAAEYQRAPQIRDILDEKSMNCMTPIMFAAFCAWDGGYMQTQPAIAAAYGSATWPWGASPHVNDEVAKIANFNAGTGFNASKAPRYLFPVVGYNTFANDFAPIIAAPGRFPGDIASVSRPGGQESWMDLGGNMIEWSGGNNVYYGWTGSSFEGHVYPRSWSPGIYFLDKYGKGGSRCIHLK